MLQFSGGASNLTYLLRFPDLDLVLRRGPSGTKAKGAHDMGREHRIQAALAPVFPYVATMVAFCDDPAVLGGGVLRDGAARRHGAAARDAGAELSPDQATRAVRRPCSTCSSSCTRSTPSRAGLDTLGKGEGYVRRQVEGWSARYRRRAHDRASPTSRRDGLARRAPARRRRAAA